MPRRAARHVAFHEVFNRTTWRFRRFAKIAAKPLPDAKLTRALTIYCQSSQLCGRIFLSVRRNRRQFPYFLPQTPSAKLRYLVDRRGRRHDTQPHSWATGQWRDGSIGAAPSSKCSATPRAPARSEPELSRGCTSSPSVADSTATGVLEAFRIVRLHPRASE